VQSPAIITCLKEHLVERCKERGYSYEESAGCIIDINANQITVDVNHPAYPRIARPGFVARHPEFPALAAVAPESGPGTELSKLLKRFGIEPTPTCRCRGKAAQMDAWGPDECERPERIEEVLAVMREEAKARGLPFLDAAGRMLIRRAIRNARRAAAS
jgi:hypothetical protein